MRRRQAQRWDGDWSPAYRDPMQFEWTGAKSKLKTADVHGSPL
jgi:hypothetical protein